jgi:hypothetical protein
MEWLQSLINNFSQLFRWFFILQPWEQALRVRAGIYVVRFQGGIHFKIPFIDFIFKQNCRERVMDTGAQTCTTLDGKTITLLSTLAYTIEDVTPLYQKLHQAQDSIRTIIQNIISDYIVHRKISQCTQAQVLAHVGSNLDLTQYGLINIRFGITDYVVVRTYRLINEGFNDYFSNHLKTDTPEEE